VKARIEIYKANDSEPIILEKSHEDLQVLRRWLSSIMEKKNKNTMIVGSIDNFESFICGRSE